MSRQEPSLPWFEPDGTLVIGGPDYTKDPVATLVLNRDGRGNNVLDLSDRSSITGAFSELTMLAQGHGQGKKSGKLEVIDVDDQSGEAEDDDADVIYNSTGSAENGFHGFIPLGIEQGGTGARDAGGARTNLGLGRVEQRAGETVIYCDDKKTAYFTAREDNQWGLFDGAKFVPLGVQQGGTGANDAATARNNLGMGNAATGHVPDVKNPRHEPRSVKINLRAYYWASILKARGCGDWVCGPNQAL